MNKFLQQIQFRQRRSDRKPVLHSDCASRSLLTAAAGSKGGPIGQGIHEVSHMLVFDYHHFKDYIGLIPAQESEIP